MVNSLFVLIPSPTSTGISTTNVDSSEPVAGSILYPFFNGSTNSELTDSLILRV